MMMNIFICKKNKKRRIGVESRDGFDAVFSMNGNTKSKAAGIDDQMRSSVNRSMGIYLH